VQFLLQFEATPPVEAEIEVAPLPAPKPAKAKKTPAAQATGDDEPKVVSLDQFRKK
jgi:hypothetical protein